MSSGSPDEHDHASAAVVTAAGAADGEPVASLRCAAGARAAAPTSDYRICYSSSVGDWDIYMTSEVAAWLENLQASDAKTADLVDDAIYALSRSGPALGDRSSTPSPARRSRISRSYALAPAAPAKIRILFVFDPWRSAVLLVAGDKSGKWNRWYTEAIPHAEQLYEIYLKERTKRRRGDEQLHQVGPRRLYRARRR